MWLLIAVLGIAMATAMSACGGDDDEGGGDQANTSTETTGEAPAEKKKISLLLSFPRSAAWLPLLIADDQGYFEEQGLDVETPETEGSGFVTQQLIAGNEEWGWAGAPSVVIAAAKDPRLRGIACNQAKNIFTVEVPEDSPIQEITDLKGKKLGITQKGGGEEPMIESILEENDMKDSVEVVPIGEIGGAAIRAVENGQVDAFAGGITDIYTLEAGGVALRDITPDKYEPMPGDCLATSEDTLSSEENQDTAARVIRAWAKGAFFAQANPDAAVEIVCTQKPEQCRDKEGFTKPFVARIIELLQPVDTSLPPTAIDLQGWETTAEVMKTSGAIEEDVDVEQLVNSPEAQAVAKLAYENVDELKSAAEQDAQAYQSGG